MGRTKQVAEISALFVDSVRLEKGDYAAYQTRRFLKPFIAAYGPKEVANVGAQELLAYRASLAAKHSVPTANAYLMAAKRCIRWSAENEFRKAVVLTGIKAIADLSEKPDKAWSVAEVRRLFEKGQKWHRQVYVWTAIQYMALARPSEVQSLVLWKHGRLSLNIEQKGEGVYAFAGKTTRKNGIKRHLVLCPEAMALLDQSEPCWSTFQTYWAGCNTGLDVGPHRFRHSSMAHLSELLGVEGFPLVRLMAGHYAEWAMTIRHYAAPQWEGLRKYGSMLAKNVPALAVDGKAEAAA